MKNIWSFDIRKNVWYQKKIEFVIMIAENRHLGPSAGGG